MATLMQQIHLVHQSPGYERVVASNDKDKTSVFVQEHDELEAKLLGMCAAHLWHNNSYSAVCPRPILVGPHHQQQLEDLHEALNTAITDIVSRWWTDKEADLPRRMPLQPEEEEHLRWLQEQVSRGNLAPFEASLGSWRPDFLVEDYQGSPDEKNAENFSITEINARFSFNGFMHEAYGQRALDDTLQEIGTMGGDGAGSLVSATSSDKILDGLFDLFDPRLPLHLLKGEEHGIDIHMFIDAVERRLGVKPRLITPDQLRLLPDPCSPGGHRLYCVVTAATNSSPSLPSLSTEKPLLISDRGETLEEIVQVGLELHQRELAALEPEVLRQVSLRCFNDMRTILLVHDKRMLGIIRQEVPELVRRGVLTPAQARTLERGVVDTLLPGSGEMTALLEASRAADPGKSLKDGYLLKPIRGGKGAGIVFGEDLNHEEWLSTLERLSRQDSLPLGPGETMFVVQRRIWPRLYDVVLQPSGEMVRYPLVGTYHVCNGKLLGLGTWRASGGRIVAVSCGGFLGLLCDSTG